MPDLHCYHALFVSIVFSDDNKIIVTNLYPLKGYNATQLRAEFPGKGWMTSSINRLLTKFRDTGTLDRATKLHHRSDSFQSHSQFPEVNKYAFKETLILFVIPFVSSERTVKIGYNLKANKIKQF